MSHAVKPTVLWVDLRTSDRAVTLIDLFSEKFQILMLDIHNPIYDRHQFTPSAICFDYDYPDMHGLTLLRELREQYPQLPVIMMSEQHSEALMVWALRVRVWEIMLKPMPRAAAEHQINAMCACIEAGLRNSARLLDISPMLRLPEESRYHGGNTETRQVHPALSFMQLHLGERITEEKLAQFCNLRPLQFSRLFKKAYGVTYQEFLQQLRIREATRLLENPEMHIIDVALTVGFRDHSYFCRVFKKYIGVTPRTYQEQQHAEKASSGTGPRLEKLQAVTKLLPSEGQEGGEWVRQRAGSL